MGFGHGVWSIARLYRYGRLRRRVPFGHVSPRQLISKYQVSGSRQRNSANESRLATLRVVRKRELPDPVPMNSMLLR